jgi:hypothetical protein
MDPRHLEHGHRPSEIAKRLKGRARASAICATGFMAGIDGTVDHSSPWSPVW